METAMQTESRILNDLGKLATGAAGVFQSLREEVETMARQRLERAVADLDVVTRDEFEAVKEMAANARMEAERLAAENAGLAERLAALEARLG
jgi:BMFP domain-containing protein YqiC